ncbi:hypothetical protein AKJ39_02705 [candidate division MSBL1 archaeon SCGC-AAA259J03]|uniref:Tyr recombinase domain-containing protein n=1 Tax=candidate division MSBL1 archaeon SCGC-AAA259J03 TaxID=1698269 RepID=A0A656YWS4_9EURY|nr:hypothetical protein AKJ39_02705 [candidate division MSBL1 archaeon SCGC-AAA259J03]
MFRLDIRRDPSIFRERKKFTGMARFTESLRDRAIILFLWTTGLRVSTAMGLNYGDIQEEFEGGEEFVKVPVYPEMKKRVLDACKGKIPYYTFAHPHAVRHLRIYLRRREAKYGPMKQDYPLFHSDWHHWEREERTKKRLNRRSVQRTVKESAKLAGIEEWESVTPHCLRKAFKSILRAPTKDGGRLDEGTQEFFMGHILPGTQDEYYDKDNVEFHREEYSKLDFSLDGENLEFGSGRGEEEPSDILVEEDELSDYLEQGWKFLEKIGDGKYIVTKRDPS